MKNSNLPKLEGYMISGSLWASNFMFCVYKSLSEVVQSMDSILSP